MDPRVGRESGACPLKSKLISANGGIMCAAGESLRIRLRRRRLHYIKYLVCKDMVHV